MYMCLAVGVCLGVCGKWSLLPSPSPTQLSHKVKVMEMASAAAQNAEHKDVLNENAEYKKKLGGVFL